MCSVLFLLVQSLITCFRSCLTRFGDFVSLFRRYNCSSDSTFHFFSWFVNNSTPCFPFLRYKGMSTVTNWPLHVHYGITMWAYLSQTHRPNQRYCTVGIPFWNSRKRQTQTFIKVQRKNPTILRAPSHMITHSPYVLQRGIRKHCTCTKWLT